MKDKLNAKQKKFQVNRRAFILMTVLCMGIGFAFLSSNLTITGNTTVSENSWNVYFSNVQVTDGSVEASVIPTTSGTNTTSIDYTVTLDKPGDFYEFTVEAVNNGTIDAMIDTVTVSNIDLRYINYLITYENGEELEKYDILKRNSTVIYKIRVEFNKDITASDLDGSGNSLNLTFGVNYIQSDIKLKTTNFTKLVKDDALNDRHLDFTEISSVSNGRGLYIMGNTKIKDYPIYYYRGAVTNNNALFAGFCWKIVRTTETGGTKLVYNGTPSNGKCTNTTGDETQLSSTSKFNGSNGSPAYVGYMYGTIYSTQTKSTSTSEIYGSSFTYVNGKYTLMNTHNGGDSTHHYTCFSSSTSCTSISYVYQLNGTTAYYVNLTDGKSIDDAFKEMFTNRNSSTIKLAIDSWFNQTFMPYFTNLGKNYNDYLEDTVWCNDRTMNTLGTDSQYINNGWIPNGGSMSNYLWYSAYGRMLTGTPNLACSNKNDSFTVTESATGNGALTYPVGLLTVDEIILAGGTSQYNSDFYLNTQRNWYVLSSYFFHNSYRLSDGFVFSSGGSLTHAGVENAFGVRPSISLKPEVKIVAGGDGTAETPYEFVVE